ncbi:nucleoside triphosphate pyrophosphohydrolase family protein [Methylobacillus caricis]|uniref:nucleoside triphosphate pyrophosphohydrolase family protein n=1 Tax=Methylobacillus caricis TaxID=1971611 RepID=UPI001CFFF21A|nr:nucleoside triphosphate pyrophosphohydrolase family protein [Methylobacillus caricis]MCB5188872.1 nucleoside triphosphate pyrophosphohydrolase family protein [Methylobacillus caricis]
MVAPRNVKTIQDLKLADYQARACKSNQFEGKTEAKDQLRFGFFGEIGGLLSLIKKSTRDLHAADHNAITEELGDALWYLTTVAIQYDLTLQDVGFEAITELQQRLNVNAPAVADELTFEKFDGLMAFSKEEASTEKITAALKQLGIHCGSLFNGEQQDLVYQPPLKILAALLADMVTVSSLFTQNFSEVARFNLKKIESRWPSDQAQYTPLFDEKYPALEQFPRQFEMRFIERHNSSGKPHVIQQMLGINIGDRLTDNRTEPDGYRFHDVFHLAYLVHLGWSPVIRALLKLKRKSDPDIDENEDGARAIIIEEGIATWIFNLAGSRNHFEDVKVGRLDYGLLKQVMDMVEGYEVAACPLWQWEKAILEGFNIFRQVVHNSGGIVHCDLVNRTMKFETLPDEQIEAPVKTYSTVLVSSGTPAHLLPK